MRHLAVPDLSAWLPALHSTRTASSRDRSVWRDIGLLLVLTWAWTAFAGKDMSWDVLNHHLYLPFSWLSGRFETDLFAAGPQSYQNPLGYLPAYLLIQHWQWPAWLVGGTLATAHAAGPIIVLAIGRKLWPAAEDRAANWPLWSALLAWSAPAYLVVVGTTSTDPITAAFVLGALNLSVGEERLGWRRAAAAGALIGLAFSVKQSNAVFGIAIGAVVVCRMLQRRSSIVDLVTLTSSALGAIALGMGAWSLHLWKTFGNPLFPLFNNIFHSPYASQQAMLASRFVPSDAWGYVERIWQAARPKEFIWIESTLPDIRLLLLALVLAALAVSALWRLRRPAVVAAVEVSGGTAHGMDAQLATFAFTAYVLWMRTSGNSRYGIPLLLIVGLLLVRASSRAFGRSPATILVALFFSLQALYYLDAGDRRYVEQRWTSGPYLAVKASQRLKDEPFLHLAVGLQTNASLAAHLNPRGAMMNPIGQSSLPTTGPLGERVVVMLKRWQGRTRVLVRPIREAERSKTEAVHEIGRWMLYRLGLSIVWSDCLDIDVEGLGAPYMMSCAVVPNSKKDPGFEAEMAVADKLFQQVEAHCPTIFGPPGMVSERAVEKWQRFYANTDAIVTASKTDGVYVAHGRSGIDRYLGTYEDVLAGRIQLPCRMWSLLAPD